MRPAREFSPWGDLARQLVEKGPISYDKLLSEVASVVPPGIAYRHALREVERIQAARATPGRNYTDSEKIKDKRIRYARREIASGVLHSFHQRGRTAYVEVNGQRMVTLGEHPWSDPKPLGYSVTPISRYLLDAVVSGPRMFDDLFLEGMHLIPYDHAVRRGIVAREANKAREGYFGESHVSDDQSFLRGARGIFNGAINGLERSERIVVSGKGKLRKVSKGPQWVPGHDS